MMSHLRRCLRQLPSEPFPDYISPREKVFFPCLYDRKDIHYGEFAEVFADLTSNARIGLEPENEELRASHLFVALPDPDPLWW